MSSTHKRKAKTKAKPKPKARPAKKRAPPPRRPAEKPAEVTPPRKEIAPEKVFLIAVRIMGPFGTPSHLETIMSSLRLKRKFNAVVLERNPGVLATLRHAKDYLTWGEINPVDLAGLLKERGELLGGLTLTDTAVREKFGEQSVDELASALAEGRVALSTLWQKGLKPVFRLHPPSGGFEASTKRSYGSRGELGYRGPEMASLLARMM